MRRLYYITQNAAHDYDMYYSAVVVAESREKACEIDPSGEYMWDESLDSWTVKGVDGEHIIDINMTWVKPKHVYALYIGSVHDESSLYCGQVVCASNKY